MQERKNRVVAEAADLLYHLLVVLAARGVTLNDVEAELGKRKQSGYQEGVAQEEAIVAHASRKVDTGFRSRSPLAGKTKWKDASAGEARSDKIMRQ